MPFPYPTLSAAGTCPVPTGGNYQIGGSILGSLLDPQIGLVVEQAIEDMGRIAGRATCATAASKISATVRAA